jgi:hypothetical protein
MADEAASSIKSPRFVYFFIFFQIITYEIILKQLIIHLRLGDYRE